VSLPLDHEEEQLRSVAIQNAQAILVARQKAEQELVDAKEALEARTAELERANALIRTIAENAASCLLMLDENGVATYMNPAAVRETGYSLEELARAPFHDVLHATASQGGHHTGDCAIRNARVRREPLSNHRDLFVRKDGSLFPVACSLAPFEQGEGAGAVLEFRNVTDELAAQKALEDASRRKDQFLATLSHELRTPMTAVLGWAKMLALGLPEEEAGAAIRAIVTSAEVQAQLIDDVLDVSRVVAGKMTFTPAPVEAGPVVQAAMTTIHPAAIAKGIEVLASVPPRLPRVLGDEGRLQQIVWNLLSNAVKFTPEGGRVQVQLERVDANVQVTVSDNGKGIEPKFLPFVFERFSQEDSSITRTFGGMGMGLAIVKSIIELHGGTVQAFSEGAGKGTTFIISLPAANESRNRQSPQPSREEPPGDTILECPPELVGLKLLVVDDDPSTCEMVGTAFEQCGARVKTVDSAVGALAQIRVWLPDILVADISMPEMDGYQLIEQLRTRDTQAGGKVPAVALTAMARIEDRMKALAAGYQMHVAKPVELSELRAVVASLASVIVKESEGGQLQRKN
jgi:PAS domain S-box-containing protein